MRLGICPNRHTIQRINIARTACVARIAVDKLFSYRHAHIIAEIRRAWLIFMLRARAVEWRIAPKQVKQTAKQRQQQNNDNPCDLIGWIIIFTHQPDDDDHAQHGQHLRHQAPSSAHPAQTEHDNDQLQHQQETADDAPVTQQTANNPAHNRLLSTIFSHIS